MRKRIVLIVIPVIVAATLMATYTIVSAYENLAQIESQFVSLEEQNQTLKESLESLDQEHYELQEAHIDLTQKHESTLEAFERVREEKLELEKKLKAATATKPKAVTVSRGARYTKELTMTATAYTAYCKGCSGITATGINLRANPGKKVIAVDPRVIPLGTRVWVEGYGEAVAADKGGAIKGNKIDIFMPSRSDAVNWGRQKVRVKILGKGA